MPISTRDGPSLSLTPSKPIINAKILTLTRYSRGVIWAKYSSTDYNCSGLASKSFFQLIDRKTISYTWVSQARPINYSNIKIRVSRMNVHEDFFVRGLSWPKPTTTKNKKLNHNGHNRNHRPLWSGYYLINSSNLLSNSQDCQIG